MVPLALAWDLGVASWSQAQRDTCANDLIPVLLSVDEHSNEQKSDSGASGDRGRQRLMSGVLALGSAHGAVVLALGLDVGGFVGAAALPSSARGSSGDRGAPAPSWWDVRALRRASSRPVHSRCLVCPGCCFGCCPGIVRSMNEREIYPNAPVVLVALEMRHPVSESLTPSDVRAIKARLRDHTPIARNAQMLSGAVVAGAQSQPAPTIEQFTRLVNRQTTIAVSFRREALVVEASVYPGWESFRVIVSDAIDARMAVAPVDGVERVGVRYIDEIRVPADGEPDWSEWVSPSLLGPASTEPISLALTQWQGVAVYGGNPGHMMVLRYGPSSGFAVDPSSELKRGKPTEGGPFFLMDVDSFWTPGDSIPEVDRDTLIAICNDLHAPVSTLFEGLIQPKLREVFNRND